MSALFTFNGYDNFVLANKIESILSTKMDMNKFMTADYQLTENPGMVKKIHRYIATGEVDDLDRGDGNTHFITASYTPEEYRVKRTQGQTRYYDDDVMTDPVLIDTQLQGLSESMVNDWTKKAIDEFNKTENQVAITDFSLGSFSDIISKYTEKYEDQEGLFLLINIKDIPTVRKMLGDYLKYTEGYIRTGAIGEILGVPVYASKALPEGIIFCATNEAVTAFFKKDVNVEQDRNIDTKLNIVVASRWTVIALTDETKCIKAGKAQATTLTATADVSEGTVTGAATTGAVVTAYNVETGEVIGTATAAANAYTITGEIPAAGKKVKVVAKLNAYLPSILTVDAQA